MSRCKIHKIMYYPFGLGNKDKTITASNFNGEPIKFTPVYFGYRSTQIIDTFQQVAIWDKSASKLTSYNLKSIVSYWMGTNVKGKPVAVNSGSYNVNYYVTKIKEVLQEMLGQT